MMAKVSDKQILTDLIVLHGHIFDREGYNPSYSKSLAIVVKRLFPKAILSQAMEMDLED